MKRLWISAFIVTALLVISAAAQDTPGETTNSVATQQERLGRGDAITVNVWSSAEPAVPEPGKVSRQFAAAGSNAAFNMESVERKIENSLKNGFPLGDFWIQNDLRTIDNSLRMAELSVANETDREALRNLESQRTRLRLWSSWLPEQNHRLGLTEYYISSSALDNDEQFVKSVACTKFLISMLASRTLTENNSCL